MDNIINVDNLYDIVVTNSFDELPIYIERLDYRDNKKCIITDSNIDGIYSNDLQKLLNTSLKYSFDAGEPNKNLDTINNIYTYLIDNHLTRKDLILALGGGVCGDMAGFASATYLRGIDYIQVPTSLLAMVDSSIGGKTGVDYMQYKNMIGAFHMPKLVYINVNTLKSLDDLQIASGMGEIIKHALIYDMDYLDMIEANADSMMQKDTDICKKIISRSIKIKKEVVSQDPYESGKRAILNYGHTLGHAIEKEMNFTLSHGACIGLGMLCSLYISSKRKFISSNDIDRIKNIMQKYGLPVKIHIDDIDKIIYDTKNDKKNDSSGLKFILLDRIGHATIVRDVTDNDMREALDTINE